MTTVKVQMHRYKLHFFGPFVGIQDNKRTAYHVCGRMSKPHHPHRRSYGREELEAILAWLNDRAQGYAYQPHLKLQPDYLQLGAERVEDLQ